MNIGRMVKLAGVVSAVPIVAEGALVVKALIKPEAGAKGNEKDKGYPLDSGKVPAMYQAIQGAKTLASSLAARIRPAGRDGVVSQEPGRSAIDDANAAWKALSNSSEVRGMPGAFSADPKAPYHASVWSMSQVFNAALDQAGRTGNWAEVNAITKRMASLYGNSSSWSDGISGVPKQFEIAAHPFYDDNAWIALGFLQANRMSGNESWVKRVEQMVPFFDSGVRSDGGVIWGRDEKVPTVNTCAAAPVGQVYAQLYAVTKKPEYLEKAKKIEEYLSKHLMRSDGLYSDNINPENGKVDQAVFSYNQGSPVGLQLELYRATGDDSYLAKAKHTAKASVQWMQKEDHAWKQPPAFNAVYFRNLMALNEVAPDPSYKKLLSEYATRAVKEGLDTSTGLYSSGGIGGYGKSGSVIDQGAMVQILELAGGAPSYR